MKKLLLALVLMFAVIFTITRFTEVTEIAEVLRRARWTWLALALLLVITWMLLSAAGYMAIYHELGMPKRFGQMALLFISALFANTVTPTAGISSIAVFLTDAARNNCSRAKVTVAWALFLLLEYIGLLTIIGLGLLVLLRRGQLDWTEISAALILFALASALSVLLYLGAHSAERLRGALSGVSRLINRVAFPLIKREYISAAGIASFSNEMADGIRVVRQNPSALRWPILLALLNKVALVAVFQMTFEMFNVPYSAGTIIAGFATCYLFTVVSPTPAGVGIVEGVLPLSLAALNVRLSAATIITLAYRGLTFWFPLMVGMITFRFFAASKD